MSSYDMTDSDGDNSFFCYPTIPIQFSLMLILSATVFARPQMDYQPIIFSVLHFG